MIKVLVLGCGTQGLALVRSLRCDGFYVILLYGDRHNYADMSRYVSKKIYCTFPQLSAEYFDVLISIIKTERVDTIIPMGDTAAEMMSRNKDVLLQYVKYLMPDYDTFLRVYDKHNLMKLCMERGYPHPMTIIDVENISSIEEDSLQFPLLIKPNITCGARGMTLVDDYHELLKKYPSIRAEYGECHLQKYIKPGGAQVEVQLFINERHELVNSSVIYKYRWYPEKGGSSCCAKSVRNEKIVSILYDLLKTVGWIGFADFDTIEDPDTGELLIMELNPRVPACVKTAIEAGIDWGQIIVDGYLNNSHKHYEYKEGEFLRHLGFEMLWFLKSPNRWHTFPCWFNFWGKHIHYQDMSDWTDPLPFICGTLRNLKKVLTHKEKEKLAR